MCVDLDVCVFRARTGGDEEDPAAAAGLCWYR